MPCDTGRLNADQCSDVTTSSAPLEMQVRFWRGSDELCLLGHRYEKQAQ